MRIFGVRWVWEMDRWDGPLAGLGEWDGRKVFIVMRKEREPIPHTEDAFGDSQWHPRVFAVYSLTPDQIAEIDARSTRFRDLVGSHSHYTGGRLVRDPAYQGPKPGWQRYYETQPVNDSPSSKRYTSGELLGWFDEDQYAEELEKLEQP